MLTARYERFTRFIARLTQKGLQSRSATASLPLVFYVAKHRGRRRQGVKDCERWDVESWL